jgi:hypothetical protein
VQLAKQSVRLRAARSSVRSRTLDPRVRCSPGIRREKVQLAKLVYDSSRALGSGLRSMACARQLLYTSGSVCIDLHVEPKPGSESVVVVGQLLDQLRPTQRVSNIPVSLFSKGTPVSSTKTNDFGEFDFAFDAPDDMHIAFGLEDEKTLVVPLPDASLKI